MIKEFSVNPLPQNNSARIIFTATLLSSFLIFVLYFSVELYRGIIGLVGLGFITATITIYTKYLSSFLYYDVTFDSDQTPVFVVRRRTGKKQTTLCRIDLGSIISVTREDKKERRAHKRDRGVSQYVYIPTMLPDVTYRLYSKSRYETSEIVIECQEEFAALLDSMAKEAAALLTESE